MTTVLVVGLISALVVGVLLGILISGNGRKALVFGSGLVAGAMLGWVSVLWWLFWAPAR